MIHWCGSQAGEPEACNGYGRPLMPAVQNSTVEYSGADFREWCGAAGFRSFDVIPLAAGSSAAVAYK